MLCLNFSVKKNDLKDLVCIFVKCHVGTGPSLPEYLPVLLGSLKCLAQGHGSCGVRTDIKRI